MGYAAIVWVYKDFLSGADRSPETWERLRSVVGEAVLRSAVRGEKCPMVAGAGNVVNLCSEVHSTSSQLFLWHRNCLRPLSALSEMEKGVVRDLCEEEVGRGGREGEARPLAEAVVRLFTSGERFQYELLRRLAEMGRGDAVYIGRTWWEYIGCPCTIEDFASCLRHEDWTRRAMTAKVLYALELPTDQERIAAMLMDALERELAGGRRETGAEDVRESIYDALRRYRGEGILSRVAQYLDLERPESVARRKALPELLGSLLPEFGHELDETMRTKAEAAVEEWRREEAEEEKQAGS